MSFGTPGLAVEPAHAAKRKWLLLPTLASLCMPTVSAQHTVESVAVEIAHRHNENAAKMIDGMTVWTSARADGKNVVLIYVLRVRKGLPSAEREAFLAGLDKEVVAPACKMNANNEAFRLGLFYTFVYRNTYAEQLAELVVSKSTCEARQ